MKKQQLKAGLLATAAVAAFVINGRAQSVDSLLDKLVDKGVLTTKEANELRQETDKDFDKAYAAKTGMPDWVTAVKFNGSFRGRYETFFNDNPNFTDRSRFRYRLLAGFTMTMKESIDVGFRLGSGDLDSANTISTGIDPISQNQSFQNNASKKGIFLDLAYATWSFWREKEWTGALTIGKMQNPFVFSDMVFDSDYTPEGASQQFSHAFNDDHVINLNVGEFILDELRTSSSDPWMFGVQLRHDAKWTSKLSGSGGVGFLSIQNVNQLTSSSVPDINVGNARATTTVVSGSTTNVVLLAPLYDFTPIVLDYALTYRLDSAPLYSGEFPVKIFGEYMINPGAPSASDTGWNAGIQFGKSGKKKTWEITYKYKFLEGDAWWEEVVDSDSGAFYNNGVTAPPPSSLRAPGQGYGSGTNIRGHIVKAGYSPYDFVTLSVAWYGLELIQPYFAGSDSRMNRVQADVLFKF